MLLASIPNFNVASLKLRVCFLLVHYSWLLEGILVERIVAIFLVSEAEVSVTQVKKLFFVEFILRVIEGLFDELIFCL